MDEHHIHSLELFNKVFDNFIGGARHDIPKTVLDELIDYVPYHFTAEEPHFLKTAESHTPCGTAIRITEGTMSMDWNDANRITLTGDLSMVGVKGQHQLLKQYVATRAEAVTAGRDQCFPLEVDLTGVQELNACGCQLLAAFLHNLRQLGATNYSFKLSDTNRIIIHNLGFDDEIYNGVCP